MIAIDQPMSAIFVFTVFHFCSTEAKLRHFVDNLEDAYDTIQCNSNDPPRSNNRSLRVFIKSNAPFAFYDVQRGSYRGTEIHLVEAIAEHLNLKTIYTSERNEENQNCHRRYIHVYLLYSITK